MRDNKNMKPKNIVKSLLRLLSYFKQYKVSLFFFVLAVIISAFSTIVSPQLIGDIINAISANFEITQNGIKFIPDFAKITSLAIMLLAICIASGLFGYLQNWLMANMVQDIVFKMREQTSSKISRLPLSFLDKNKTGDTVSIITNDIETISDNLVESVNQILFSVTVIIGVAVMMVKINLEMSLIAGITTIVAVGLIAIVTKFTQIYFLSLQDTTGKINAFTEEMLSNHEIIKSYNGEEDSINKFKAINNEMFSNSWKSQFFGGLIYPLMGLIRNISRLVIALIGGLKAINGQMSVGDVSAFIQYMGSFTQPLAQIANSMTVIQTTLAASERVFNFLDAEEEKEEENAKKMPKNIKGHVEFSKVNFSYSPNKPVITNFSATIQPNSNVAIVGPTGAGKTTIVNLLMRFYDIDSGKIKIDGVDTSKVSRRDIRSLFGMVLQDTWLFNGTIEENLKYGKPDATHEEVVVAAKAAHADHFIRTLPEGYNTIISQDVDNISSGEKQLLTIARAILADSPMLILDEATSSVDTRTEAAIQSAMDNLAHGRTSFVIAHRLSTIRNADLILVMDKGNIIEQGTHDELLKIKGHYSALYNSQFASSLE